MEFDLSNIIDTLDNAVSEAFEAMAFSEIARKEVMNTLPEWTADAVGSSIEISHPLTARLLLFVSKKHALNMLEVISGNDKSPDFDTMLKDIIGEMANEIAGKLATTLLRGNGEVKVGLPCEWRLPQPVSVEEACPLYTGKTGNQEFIIAYITQGIK